MNFISAENLSKSFADKVLFEGISFGLDQGQKVALIGVNGSGKSTLLKMVAGMEEPDEGRISRRNGIKVAYLPQEPNLPVASTVAEVVFDGDVPELQLIQQYELLTIQAATDPEAAVKLSEVIGQIDSANAWDYEVKINQILGRLEVDFLERKIGELSGGQKKRVALAQALIGEPDLLIMDEPTNHLDLASIEWLEQFLATAKQSLLLVTHDRYFLDSITNEIFELNGGELFRYQGDYAYYLAKKEERELNRTTEADRAKSLYKKELEWLRRSPKARTTKSKSRIEAAGVIEEKSQYKQEDYDVTLKVKGRRIGGKVLELKNLRKAYGELNILDNFSYTFNRRDRIGVIGPNGVGKTTFLKLLLGEAELDSGKIRWGETIVAGHYRQDGFTFKDNARIIEVVTEAAESVELSKSETVSAAQLLEHFLFPRHRHHAMVSTLSGGEKRRLHLLRILMTNPNFLILDEPTNDLDLITLRKLEEFLAGFEGCLVVVTHDRFFMDRLVDHMFVFEGEGQVRDFPGSYSQYRETRDEKREARQEKPTDGANKNTTNELGSPSSLSGGKSVGEGDSGGDKRDGKAAISKPRKLSYKEKRELEQITEEIEKLESRVAELKELISSGTTDFEALTKWSVELQAVESELEEKGDRWLELEEIGS